MLMQTLHTVLLITFLIFNQFSIRKKFWKAETEGFFTIPNAMYVDTVNVSCNISNAFNDIYVDTVDTKHESV